MLYHFLMKLLNYNFVNCKLKTLPILLFQNHYRRLHKNAVEQDVKDSFCIVEHPVVAQQEASAPSESEDIPDAHHQYSQDDDVTMGDISDDATSQAQENLSEFVASSKDDFGNFLCKLESVYHVPQQAVAEIASEVHKISSRVHTFTKEQVQTDLGRKTYQFQ